MSAGPTSLPIWPDTKAGIVLRNIISRYSARVRVSGPIGYIYEARSGSCGISEETAKEKGLLGEALLCDLRTTGRGLKEMPPACRGSNGRKGRVLGQPSWEEKQVK